MLKECYKGETQVLSIDSHSHHQEKSFSLLVMTMRFSRKCLCWSCMLSLTYYMYNGFYILKLYIFNVFLVIKKNHNFNLYAWMLLYNLKMNMTFRNYIINVYLKKFAYITFLFFFLKCCILCFFPVQAKMSKSFLPTYEQRST